MKNLLPKLGFCLFLVAASGASAGVPFLNVTVSDAAGKTAFKGATKDDGVFATPKLQPGNYVVQFTAKNSAVKGGQYAIVVASGQKKVVAGAVPGEKFLGAGVAMRVEVGAGLNITGQVSTGISANHSDANGDSLRKMQDHAQDAHQEGFRVPMSQAVGHMGRP
ncbi:MAG: carboxypeptidase-like regulatory domain-containing protein [Verrucomicrobiota bacterium]|nr:carboxypeptidase-like regulatory domain-containing protein [Verrucomicrobiota bacterium]